MLPTSHLASGYILAYLLHSTGLYEGFTLYLVILASVLIDMDYFIQHSHRDLITHTPFFWIVVLAPFILWRNELVVVLVAVMLHLLMDMVDWSIMPLYPLSRRHRGLKILFDLDSNSMAYFLKRYVTNFKTLLAEISVICIAILLAITTGFLPS